MKDENLNTKETANSDLGAVSHSTIGVKFLNNVQDELAYLFNALDHNDENEDADKIDKALSLLHEVSMNQVCFCMTPKAAIPLALNKCEKCGKRLVLKYCG